MAEAELIGLGALVLVAAAARAASRALRAPPAATFIAAGFLARPLLPVGEPIMDGVLVLALAFLLFGAGVAMHPARFARGALAPALAVGLVGAVVVAVLAAVLVTALGWGPRAVPYAAAAVALSSTLLVLQSLALRGEMQEPHARVLVGGLLAQDAVALLLVAALPAVPQDAALALRAVLATVALAALALLVARLQTAERVWRLAPDAEVRTLVAFGVLFGFLLLAGAARLPLVIGAFLAGLAVSRYPANVHLRPAVRVSREFFTPVFFVALGAYFPLPTRDGLLALAGLVALAVLAKPIVLGFVARATGLTRRVSAEVGAHAGQASELALVLVIAGLVSGDLANREFGVIGLAVAGSLLLSPFLKTPMVALLERVLPADAPPPPVPREGHVVVVGVGDAGRLLAAEIRERGREVVAVDADPHALALLQPDVPRVLGDATSEGVMEAAHVDRASAVFLILRKDEATVSIARALRAADAGRLVAARVRSRAAATELERLGARAFVVEDAVAAAVERALAGLTLRPPGAPREDARPTRADRREAGADALPDLDVAEASRRDDDDEDRAPPPQRT